MAETLPLLNKAVEFLEEISLGLKIDIARCKTEKRYFEILYLKLKKNLEELKKLKDEMEQRGFDSPYFALGIGRYGSQFEKQSYRREDVEDQRDVARHKMFFRTNASFKKGTFERTKSAIAAHNIAIGHLEEFVSFECECGRRTHGKDVTSIIEELGGFICPKCCSYEPKLVENENGVFRIEILPHLVFGGEFTHEISKFTPTERMAYRELVEVLREKRKGKIKSATISFRVFKGGRWTRKKEQIEVEREDKFDYERILKEKYGRIVIEHIRYHHERSILLSGRYNRQVIAAAYTKVFKEKKDEILDFLLEKNVDIAQLKKYERAKREIESKMNGMIRPEFSMDTRIAEERKELMDEFDVRLKQLGLMDKYGNLNPALDKAIEYRKKVRKETLIQIPRAMFAWDIFKFLLIKPYRERRYASIFPGLQPVPEKEQLQPALEVLKDRDTIAAIEKFVDRNVISINNADEIVFKKFELENILQDYLKVTSSRAVGGVSLYLSTALSLGDSAGVVSAKVSELEEVLKVIIRLGRREVIPPEKLEGLEDIKSIRISDKAKEFLELVR